MSEDTFRCGHERSRYNTYIAPKTGKANCRECHAKNQAAYLVRQRAKADQVSVERPDGTVEIFPVQHGYVADAIARFVLDRAEDVSGISGTGIVAEGVMFSDGTAVLRWVVGLRSTAVYDSMDDLVAIHGHNGATQVRWLD
jgi:hypothetical protein